MGGGGSGYAYDVLYCKFTIGPTHKCVIRGEAVSEFGFGLRFYLGLELWFYLKLGSALQLGLAI